MLAPYSHQVPLKQKKHCKLSLFNLPINLLSFSFHIVCERISHNLPFSEQSQNIPKSNKLIFFYINPILLLNLKHRDVAIAVKQQIQI